MLGLIIKLPLKGFAIEREKKIGLITGLIPLHKLSIDTFFVNSLEIGNKPIELFFEGKTSK